MMEWIGNYIISIICASAICGIITSLVSNNKATGGIIRMICGIFLAVVLVSPLLKMKLIDFEDYINSIQIDAKSVAGKGAGVANAETASIIKSELESYILEKAAAMNLSVSVQITMSGEFPPIPYSIELSGSISPYNKNILAEYIVDELGIPEERQIWN